MMGTGRMGTGRTAHVLNGPDCLPYPGAKADSRGCMAGVADNFGWTGAGFGCPNCADYSTPRPAALTAWPA